ncbi:MAG: TolC family protein [Bacteroidales bacterium]|nr:TolC family protein [Bacteroidales bacterium]
MRTIILFVLSLLPFVAMSQTTLDDCLRKAREHYPEVASYGLAERSGEYSMANAARGWQPRVVLSAQATWQTAVASFPEYLTQMLALQGIDMPGIAQDQYRLALDVSQMVWDGGVSRATQEVARRQTEVERGTTDVSLYAIEERVEELYFGLLMLDEQHEVLLSHHALVEEMLQRLRSRQQNGTVLQSDIDYMEVDRIAIEQQMEQNRALSVSYRSMLELFVGESLDGQTLTMPTAKLMLPGSERPEMRLFDMRLSAVDAQQMLIGRRTMPVVSAFAQGFYGNPGLDMFKSMTSRNWTWNAVVGIRMQWDISSLFNYRSDCRQLDLQRERIGLQRDVFLFNNSLLVQQRQGEVSRLQKTVAADERITVLRERIRRSAQSQHENGVIDTPTLMKSIADETDARRTYAMHAIELQKALFDLQRTIGVQKE